MVNISEILKSIMKEYNLNQTMFSRAIDCDYSNVSRWCNGVRKPDIETLEHILNTFGYGLNIELIEKNESVKPKAFYMKKSYNQLKDMKEEELVDYIFVTQEEEVLANICGVPSDVFEYISLGKQRELISKKINGMSILEIYFRISKMYKGVEESMAYFIEHAKHHLEDTSKISKEVLAQAEYLMFDVNVHNAMYEDEYFTLYNFRLLDKNRNLLDVSSDDIDNYEDVPLDDCLDNEIGDYFFDTVHGINAEVKLNY